MKYLMTAAGLCFGQVICVAMFGWSFGQAFSNAYWACFGIVSIWLYDRFWRPQ